MGMTVLVTGANGFVGKNLVARLARVPDMHLVATDLQDTLLPLEDKVISNVEYVSGDLTSGEMVDFLTSTYRFDSIIHLAAVISQNEDTATYQAALDANINATFLLLAMARAHHARMLFTSTALVYGRNEAPFTEAMRPEPEVFYAMSKFISEELLRFYTRKHGVPHLIFRAGVFYGPGQLPTSPMFVPSMIAHLLSGKEFPMTQGEQVRDFVYIGDFTELIVRALADPEAGGTYNVGSGKAPAMKEIALLAEELTGQKGLVRIGARPYRSREVWNYCLDPSAARRQFGWQAGIGIRRGLQQTIAFQQRLMKGGDASTCC